MDFETLLCAIGLVWFFIVSSFVLIFREYFSKKFRDKYLNYWALKDPFMAYIFLLPLAILFIVVLWESVIKFMLAYLDKGGSSILEKFL